eukprot:TRINITY_DN100413_c0_g1_i1.p1 TRINITY_DN100413_c0_g1~~TRINITY_DN100413_c0_g1_i1.p1  ORF type:complete len:239 (-),score=61.17 TRINITY_DN100413_c0_g1_i1:110-826(-)
MAVLSPRAYAALTRGGDGAGIVARLEAMVRELAEEEWRKSGEPDPNINWQNAERQLVLPTGSGLLGNEGTACKDELLELQELRRRDAESQAELAALRKRLQEVEGQLHPKIDKLREELACTDRLLVERNQHCREVELASSVAKQTLKHQAEELASTREDLALALSATQAAEDRCRAQEAAHQDLLEKLQKLQKLHKLQCTQYALKDAAWERCGQHSRIFRSKSGGMLATKLHSAREHW